MSQTPSPTDSELLEDSPKDLTEQVDSNYAKFFYQTAFVSPSSSLELEENQSSNFTKMAFQQAANVPLPPPTPTEFQPSTSNQQVFQWNDELKSVIYEHRAYCLNMLNFLNEIEKTGPPTKLPKPPKRKLRELLKEKPGKKKKQEEMTPQGFHNYLLQHIQDITKSISRKPFAFELGEHVNIANGIEQLKNAYKHLCRQNSQSMYFNCDFGIFLNALYKWFEKKKIEGLLTVSWQVWLNKHINISDSHARNLRQLGTLLYDFPKLKSIDLPLNEILRNKKILKEMLTIPDCAAFWKEGIQIPIETHSSQEQA